jgi:glycosyltransferase involved in cell wall biosynthesis
MSTAIVIPTFNSAAWLEATIASALNQTQRATAVLVVDDGSTDGTPAIAAKFGPQIQYVTLPNGGVSRARNAGAERTGDARWLLFLDSDDRLLPHALEQLVATAETAATGVCYGRVILRQEPPAEPRLHGTSKAEGAPPKPARACWRRAVITTPGAALVRRDLHRAVGGFVPGLEPMEDRDFWIKCGMLASFTHCDTVVLDKTWRAGSAVSQHTRRIRAELRARLAFPAWCRERGLDPAAAGFSTRQAIVGGIKEALACDAYEPMREILTEARALGVHSFWLWRARIKLLGR